MINHYEIEPEELLEILEDKNQCNNIAIIDVREDDERKEYGMIENSIIMPFASLNNEIIADFIKNNMQYQNIYIYCRAGVRSFVAIQMFSKYLKENYDNDTQFNFY
ncbi:MAG: rhodanese-like domain-containing protein, partial [Anaplasmataceae bacterium]|nr:rhodanese-like domain-containing protein [Anaplasmataceae bacterium]